MIDTEIEDKRLMTEMDFISSMDSTEGDSHERYVALGFGILELLAIFHVDDCTQVYRNPGVPVECHTLHRCTSWIQAKDRSLS